MPEDHLRREIFRLINDHGIESFVWETAYVAERLIDFTHDQKYKKQLGVIDKDLKDTYCKVKLIDMEG